MAVRTTATALLRRISLPAFQSLTPVLNHVSIFPTSFFDSRGISYTGIRCLATQYGVVGRKASSRLSQVQRFLLESDERAESAADDSPPPKLRLEHVSVSFAMSGGPGSQNFNKVSPKVDMRFNVKKAHWLSQRIRDKILVLEKNRINKEGEIVVSSKKTLTQQGNIEDCLKKLQAIIDAAAYVPPPPSEVQKKTIAELSAKSEQKRLQTKKVLSQKKQF